MRKLRIIGAILTIFSAATAAIYKKKVEVHPHPEETPTDQAVDEKQEAGKPG